jgi:hypothetical protein
MLTINARLFANMLQSLDGLERVFSKFSGPITPEVRAQMRAEVAAIEKFCEQLAIPMGADAVQS